MLTKTPPLHTTPHDHHHHHHHPPPPPPTHPRTPPPPTHTPTHPLHAAPAGAASTWKVDRIANNFVNYNSTGLSIAGHVTLPSGLTAAKAARLVKMVDVTPFVRASSGPVSIVLLRPFRNNAETASGSAVAADTLNGGAFACFTTNSTQAADRPALLLQ